MSERSLVVRQGSLGDMETAMTKATEKITKHLTDVLDSVDTLTPTWTPETPSRVAQLEHEKRLREGVTRLTEALDSVRAAVATFREDAHDIEVENVAIVG